MTATAPSPVLVERKAFTTRELRLQSGADRSPALYPPHIAPDVMAKLTAAGVDASYFLLETLYGHDATTPDAPKFAPTLEAFIDSVAGRDASAHPRAG